MDALTPLAPAASASRLRWPSIPARGVLIGLIVTGLGAALVRTSGQAISVADASVMGIMALTAVVAAKHSRRMVQKQAEAVAGETSSNGWMTVVVGDAGPADQAGMITQPKAPPRNDPERRSLARRAADRRPVKSGR